MTPTCAPLTLSTRNEQVLLALADGLSNEEIGAELHLSTKTIKCYVKELLDRLGARNRTHAVALAYHHGLLRPKAQA